jgi:hypothetical protein
MKFFPILLILGFTLLVFGSVIEIKYADCSSDVSIAGQSCVSHLMHDFTTISLYVGLGCILASFTFLMKKKDGNDIFVSEDEKV